VGEWAYKGVKAWRKTVADWFGSLGNEKANVETNDVRAVTGDKIGVVHAFVTIKGVSAEGKVLRSMQNRFTWILQDMGGVWMIIQEHSSAPVGFETSKVMLQPKSAGT
jgi:ketosteroid isomerase-like protein